MKREYRLPEVLSRLLDRNHMTQRQFAKEIHTTTTSTHKWMAFKAIPSLFMLMAISEYFNVTLDYLVYGEKK